jgi:hypothetical protein
VAEKLQWPPAVFWEMTPEEYKALAGQSTNRVTRPTTPEGIAEIMTLAAKWEAENTPERLRARGERLLEIEMGYLNSEHPWDVFGV